MKALTLTQPWATLVANGDKRIETRSWKTSYRGPLAIHAAKGFPRWAKDSVADSPFLGALTENHGGDFYPENIVKRLPVGFVIAVCRLVDVRETGGTCAWEPDKGTNERAFGDYSPGRFMWLLEDVRPLALPIAAKGALSLWEWSAPEGMTI